MGFQSPKSQSQSQTQANTDQIQVIQMSILCGENCDGSVKVHSTISAKSAMAHAMPTKIKGIASRIIYLALCARVPFI